MANVIDLATYRYNVELNDSGFSSRLRSTERQAQRASGNMQGSFNGLSKFLKGAFVVAGVGAMVKFGKSIVDASSNAEELDNKFNVVFGNMKESTKDWIDNYARDTARGTQATKELMAGLQDVQTGFGDTTKHATAFNKAVVGVTNDLSSFSNVGFKETSDAIEAGLGNQFQALRKLGVGINVAIIDQSEYAKSLGKTWKDMDNLEKREAILNQIMQQSSNAIGQNITKWEDYNYKLGDAAKTSDSFENQSKLLKQSLTDFGAELGKVVLPLMSDLVTTLNDFLPSTIPYIKATFQAISDGMSIVSAYIKPFTDAFINSFKAIFGIMGQLSGISKRVTQNQKEDVETRINALKKEKQQRIQALKEQGNAEKDFTKQSTGLSKQELKAKKSAIKEDLDARKNALSDKKDMIKEEKDTILDNLEQEHDAEKERYDQFVDNKKEEIDLRKEQLDITLDQIDEEIEKVQDMRDEKLEALDEEYVKRLKLVDTEMAAEVEKLNAEKNKIKLEDKRAKDTEKRYKQELKINELNEKIHSAKTYEERKKAENDLSEYTRELQIARAEEKRENEIKSIENQIKNIETEAKQQKEALKESQKLEEKNIKDQATLELENLNNTKKTLNAEFTEFKKNEENKLKERKKSFDEYNKLYEKERKEITKNYDTEIKSIEKQIKEVQRLKSEQSSSSGGDIGGGSISAPTIDIGSVEDIEAEYDELIKAQEEKLNELNDDANTFDFTGLTSIKNIIGDLGTIFTETVETITLATDIVKEIAGDITTSITNWAIENKDTLDSIRENFTALFEAASNIVQIGLKIIQSFWEKHGKSITSYLTGIIDTITKFISGALAGITDILNIFIDIFNGDWAKLWEDVKKLVVDYVTTITEFISGFFTSSKKLLNVYKKAISELITKLLDGIVSLVTTIIGSIVGIIKGIFEDIKTAIKDKLDEAKSIVKDKLNSIATVFTNIFTDIKDTVGGIVDGLKTSVLGFVDGIGKAIDKINIFKKKKKDVDFNNTSNNDNVDGSHRNGLDNVPFDGYIAKLHKNERVLTASENRQYTQGGTTSKIEIKIDKLSVREEADINKIANKLDRVIESKFRARGLVYAR